MIIFQQLFRVGWMYFSCGCFLHDGQKNSAAYYLLKVFSVRPAAIQYHTMVNCDFFPLEMMLSFFVACLFLRWKASGIPLSGFLAIKV